MSSTFEPLSPARDNRYAVARGTGADRRYWL